METVNIEQEVKNLNQNILMYKNGISLLLIMTATDYSHSRMLMKPYIDGYEIQSIPPDMEYQTEYIQHLTIRSLVSRLCALADLYRDDDECCNINYMYRYLEGIFQESNHTVELYKFFGLRTIEGSKTVELQKDHKKGLDKLRKELIREKRKFLTYCHDNEEYREVRNDIRNKLISHFDPHNISDPDGIEFQKIYKVYDKLVDFSIKALRFIDVELHNKKMLEHTTNREARKLYEKIGFQFAE